ncbi:MAG: hypothetical protein M3492_03980, partial [Actinomycetota bacterium]|nr:hypothetical protein [Actinomycetota bacterium]
MLQLGETMKVIDGVTVFSDHADPNRFWYLPAPVVLADKPDGSKAFTFIKYTDKAKTGGARGGGFLMFETMLTLDKGTERSILSALRSEADDPTLEMVPFDEGSVECVALNLQGGGGTTAAAATPGGFNAVEEILGTSVPSLFGENRALFSLTLSQEGSTILEQALAKQAAPIGVIYKLKFTALRPSLHVRIKADLERVYDELSAGLSANVAWFGASIEAAFQKLVQEGVIDIKVLTFSTDTDLKDKEKWALDFFKDNLLSTWFSPSLSPQSVPAAGTIAPTLPTRPGGGTTPAGGPTPPGGPRLPVSGPGSTPGQPGG